MIRDQGSAVAYGGPLLLALGVIGLTHGIQVIRAVHRRKSTEIRSRVLDIPS